MRLKVSISNLSLPWERGVCVCAYDETFMFSLRVAQVYKYFLAINSTFYSLGRDSGKPSRGGGVSGAAGILFLKLGIPVCSYQNTFPNLSFMFPPQM